MKIVVGELQLPARVIMINRDVNDSHEEKNRVKYKPLENKNGEDKSIFSSSPWGWRNFHLSKTGSLDNTIQEFSSA